MNKALEIGKIKGNIRLKKTPLYLALENYNDRREFTNRELKGSIKEIKERFFNTQTYKWSLKKCFVYIQEVNIKPDVFIQFLNRVFQDFYTDENLKGKSTALKFLDALKNSNHFNNIDYSIEKISLKNDTKTIDFLLDMKNLNKHLAISEKNMIEFIHRHFNTGLKPSTLKRYYLDNKK